MRAKTTIKRKINKLTHRLKSKVDMSLGHLSTGNKVSLFALLLIFISLWMSWVYLSEDQLQKNSFSTLLGYNGYFISLLLWFVAFQIVSIKRKHKLQYISGFSFQNSHIIFFAAFLVFTSCIQSYFHIGSLSVFTSNIEYQNGIILCMTGSIILFVSSLIVSKEEKKELSGSYIFINKNNPELGSRKSKEENMTLPI